MHKRAYNSVRTAETNQYCGQFLPGQTEDSLSGRRAARWTCLALHAAATASQPQVLCPANQLNIFNSYKFLQENEKSNVN